VFGFVETSVFDFEFSQELSGRRHRLFGDDLLSHRHPPYPIGPDSLVVAYYASAEVSCHRALGWPVPSNILDLHAEFCTITNGRYRPCGKGLLGALAYFGLNAMDAVEKDTMRQLAIRGGPYTAQEERELSDYCEADVTSTQKLLMAMLPHIDIERALLRGRYMAAAAQIEDVGIPIDMEAFNSLLKHWDNIKNDLIKDIDADYGVFDGRTFKTQRWEQWLTAHNIPWPRLPTGHLALDDDTFKQKAEVYPAIGVSD
jgi:DNA polymerase-1